jgi:hypothetical protein
VPALIVGFRALLDELLSNVHHLTGPGLVRQLRREMALA